MYLFIDAESIPRKDIVFDESYVSYGNAVKEDTRKKKYEETKLAFENGTDKRLSVDTDLARIISLGYILTDDKFIEIERDVFLYPEDDKLIIGWFIEKYNGMRSCDVDDNLHGNPYPTIIGWNSKHFDIPLVWKRSIIHNINLFSYYVYLNLVSKYKSDSIDLMHIWNNYERGKLIHCCNSLGIKAKSGMDGSMIFDAFKAGKYQEIQDYNLQDCEACLEIARRIL